MTKKIRTYSAAFKAEAVKKIADNNGNVSATAKHRLVYEVQDNAVFIVQCRYHY